MLIGEIDREERLDIKKSQKTLPLRGYGDWRMIGDEAGYKKNLRKLSL
jgi:hypothetical protein